MYDTLLCLCSAGNQEAFYRGHQGQHWRRACYGPAANHFLPTGLPLTRTPPLNHFFPLKVGVHIFLCRFCNNV